MSTQPEFIASTAGQVAAELARRGFPPEQKVMVVAVEPNNWVDEARRYSRPKIIAEGWTDTDVQRIIDEEREAVQPHLG